ncbi:MAG: Asp-tRNA(Asn)/Glu-tRNA(Gln) amidotransferase subunit GatA [Bacteroidota bacterium]
MTYPTFSAAHAALAAGETSCEALVSAFLAEIDARNEHLNAFTSVDRDGASNHARYLDAQRGAHNDRPLEGLVLGVKDVFCIRGRSVSCSSRMLEGFTSLFDATVIERLRDAGALFIGTTNCDEFAMGSSNENSHYGPVRHPDDPERVPGGSSGGSAAAVAAGLCHAALGSDTGGSVRQPAAFCGVVGLKPTYGRVSRYGLVAYASSFDTVGLFGRTVEDVARIFTVMAGHDPADATSMPVPVPPYAEMIGRPVAGLRIGLPQEYFAEGLDPEVRRLVEAQVETLRAQGAEVKPVSLPHTKYGIATYYVLTTAEASSNLARYDGVRYGYRADEHAVKQAAAEGDRAVLEELYVRSRSEGFGEEVKRRIMLGTYVLSAGYYDAYYGKAQRVRRLIRADFDRAFEEVDVLATPATPTPAFKLGEKTDDPLSMYLTDVYTVTANLAGVPGLVVPAGTHPNGLPVGLQLLGRHFGEATLLQAGAAVERA